MRTIKFRGFNPATQEIVSWEGMQGWTMGGLQSPNIMQFTGLLDKNGKEIYEGDIVRILYTDWASQSDYSIPLEEYKKSISKIGKIEWNEDAYWCLNFGKSGYGDDDIGGLHEGPHGEKEIIGNIYENPELLSNPVQ